MNIAAVERERGRMVHFLIVLLMVFLALISYLSWRHAQRNDIVALTILSLLTCLYVMSKERSLRNLHRKLVRQVVSRQLQVDLERTKRRRLGTQLEELGDLYQVVMTSLEEDDQSEAPEADAARTESPYSAHMAQLGMGYWSSRCVHVAAELGIADALTDGPMTVDELARATATHSPSLYRLMRVLSSLGLFAEENDRAFSLTPFGATLRLGAPESRLAPVRLLGGEPYHAWGNLLHSIRTGQAAFDDHYGSSLDAFFSEHPDKARAYREATIKLYSCEIDPILEAFDFTTVNCLADLSGAGESFLVAALRKHSHLTGVLFDSPDGIATAMSRVDQAGFGKRIGLVTGNLLEGVEGGADGYLLCHVLHRCNDEKAALILRNCHEVMEDAASLLVVEQIVPAGNDFSISKLFDLHMLVMTGGKERREEEYRTLLESGGFELNQVVPTASDASLIVARKA